VKSQALPGYYTLLAPLRTPQDAGRTGRLRVAAAVRQVHHAALGIL